MFQNAALDVAIGLVLMYLMLSLLCTVINEYIATKLKIRANTLADALQKMLDDPTLRGAFYKNGLILSNAHATATGAQTVVSAVASGAESLKSLVSTPALPAPAPAAAPAPAGGPAVPAGTATPAIDPKANHPSYLSGRTVALALLGSLDTQKAVPAFGDLKAAVETMQPSSVRDALLAALTEAQGDMDKLRMSVATWFDDSMERLSGAYKRKLQWISMLIGLVVAIAFNADSFKVGTTLWNDPALRASMVEVATEAAKKAQPPAGQDVNEEKLRKQIQQTQDSLRGLPIGWSCPVPSAAPVPPAAQPGSGQAAPSPAPAQSVGKVEKSSGACFGESWWDTLVKLLGWLLTAAALSLGAPFWFDLLNKFINLRGAGAKPAREDQK
jgi:hypothetical protein